MQLGRLKVASISSPQRASGSMNEVGQEPVLPTANNEEPTYSLADVFKDSTWGSTISQAWNQDLVDEIGLPPKFSDVTAASLLQFVCRVVLIREHGSTRLKRKLSGKISSRRHTLQDFLANPEKNVVKNGSVRKRGYRGEDLMKKVFGKCYGTSWRHGNADAANCWKEASTEVRYNWHVLANLNPDVPEFYCQPKMETEPIIQCGGVMFTWHTDWVEDLDRFIATCVLRGLKGEDLAELIKRNESYQHKFLDFHTKISAVSRAVGFDLDGYCAEVCCNSEKPRIHLHSFHSGDWRKLPPGTKTLPQLNVVRAQFRYDSYMPHVRTLQVERNRHPMQAICLGFYYVLAEKRGHCFSYSALRLFHDVVQSFWKVHFS